MAPRLLPRAAAPALRRAAREFPVVVLSGPRQSGKTTALRSLFGRTHAYVSLEPPDVRGAAEADPRGFLAAHPPPVIFDEVPYAPGLLPYLKEAVDARRAVPGQYLLTGSQDLLLLAGVSESLAGRAAVLRLLPLSIREARGRIRAPLPWEAKAPGRAPALPAERLWGDVLRGGFPELRADPGRDASLWHGSYARTYLERDVRILRQVGDLTQFQSFLRALAARNGALLDLSGLSRDLGVAVNTCKAWLSVLEASFQVIVLRPYFANVGKRLVKSPKVYFLDTGTLCHLVGLRDPVHAAAGPMGGSLFETAVLLEVLKTLVHRGEDPALYFWRTAAGVEVDLVVDTGRALVPVEAKSSATPNPAMGDGIRAFRAALGSRAAPGFVVHPGATRLPLGPGITAIPFAHL